LLRSFGIFPFQLDLQLPLPLPLLLPIQLKLQALLNPHPARFIAAFI
jgi:hypothetical protein